MDRLVTLSRAFYASAAVLTVLAVATVIAWRPPAPARAAIVATAGVPGAPANAPQAAPTAVDSALIGQIVSSNIFSPDRAPPRRRYAPPSTAPAQPATADTAPSGPPPMRLYGVTLSAAGDSVALIEAEPSIPGAELYRIGDDVRTALLAALSESTAVLKWPDGRQTILRLTPRTPRRP
jgi:hypothetical protein